MDNNLLAAYPHVAAEWHPTKNGELTPEKVSPWNKKKAWWLGVCGHEWDAVISSRASVKPTGCRFCSGREALAGFNDLGSQFPLLSQLWHPTLNGQLTPSKITAGSNKKVWWLCEAGHTFDDSPMNRTAAAHPCPVCINKRCQTGVNDVATLHPYLLEEWDEGKNEGVNLSMFVEGSPKQVWWRCSLGHSWSAPIRARAQRKTQCLYCSGQKTLGGFNDLASQMPEIAAEWHPTKNGELTPERIHSGAGIDVWWQCAQKHEWKASVSDRKIRGFGCPYCCGRQSILGETDMATTHPGLAAEWHPSKNSSLLPSMLSAGSSRKVWWQCEKGHEWETSCSNRKAGKGCSNCANLISRAELEICEYVQTLLPNETVIRGDRKLLKGKELDIYIPSKNIAIEFNGVYWHTELQGKDNTYHYSKWFESNANGVQLIQIWEDDWKRSPEQIKSLIADRLGCSTQQKIFVGNTKVVAVSVVKMQDFMTEAHIEGFASGSHYLGLVEVDDETGTLLAGLVLGDVEGKVGTVIRYASTASISGGLERLLRYAVKEYELESVTALSDHCLSDSGFYESNGLIKDKEFAPDYTYLVGHQRRDRAEYSVDDFKSNPTLLWEVGLTEQELADRNKLPRIWNAGTTRYRYLTQP